MLEQIFKMVQQCSVLRPGRSGMVCCAGTQADMHAPGLNPVQDTGGQDGRTCGHQPEIRLAQWVKRTRSRTGFSEYLSRVFSISSGSPAQRRRYTAEAVRNG